MLLLLLTKRQMKYYVKDHTIFNLSFEKAVSKIKHGRLSKTFVEENYIFVVVFFTLKLKEERGSLSFPLPCSCTTYAQIILIYKIHLLLSVCQTTQRRNCWS